MDDKEIWRDIKGFEGLYQISIIGRVRSLDRVDSRGNYRKGKALADVVSGNGYHQVNLWRDGKVEIKLTHRLMAKTFIPNPDNLPQVNHRDEDKGNNRVENLEWCTASYNTNYGTRNERAAKANEQAIHVTDRSGNRCLFESIEKASKVLGLKPNSVSDCLHGRQKTHRGYSFELAV